MADEEGCEVIRLIRDIDNIYDVFSPKETSSFIFGQNKPVVFHEYILNWKCRHWSPEYFCRQLAQLSTRFRFFPRSSSPNFKFQSCKPVMETDCEFLEGTFLEFYSWLQGDERNAGKFARFPKTDYWCYADYKYMSELFKDFPDLLQAVDWSVFGFEGRDGNQSTIWIGSDGASTPCHMDTYGCNLVAQIHGKKKWTLFPPNETHKLYPTRLPYEESSIFSRVNVTSPDLYTFPEFAKAEKYEVVLKPGDVLFVPKHWWHYVESLEASISVNSWIEVESDSLDRVQEAVTRILVCSLKSAEGLPPSTWLNPTELQEIGTYHQNLEYLRNALSEVGKQSAIPRVSLEEKSHTDNTATVVSEGAMYGNKDVTDTLINCLTLPPVVKVIAEQLIQQVGREHENNQETVSAKLDLKQRQGSKPAESSFNCRLDASLKRKHSNEDSS